MRKRHSRLKNNIDKMSNVEKTYIKGEEDFKRDVFSYGCVMGMWEVLARHRHYRRRACWVNFFIDSLFLGIRAQSEQRLHGLRERHNLQRHQQIQADLLAQRLFLHTSHHHRVGLKSHQKS